MLPKPFAFWVLANLGFLACSPVLAAIPGGRRGFHSVLQITEEMPYLPSRLPGEGLTVAGEAVTK